MDYMNRAPCLLCESSASSSLHERKQENLAFLVCEGCGLTSLHPKPTPEALAEWYGSGEGSSHNEGVVSAHRKSALTSSRKIRETLQWCLKVSGSQSANST